MPDHRRRYCQRCRGHRDDVGPISWRGLCIPCAKAAVSANVDGLGTMSGPPLQRWRRGMATCVGAVLLDDGDTSPHTAGDA